MRTIAKTIICAVLAGCISLSVVACGEDKNAEISIRSAESVRNILQDKSYEDLDAGEYAVTVARNEYESRQIILTPNADVDSYIFSTANLTSADGNVLKSECFEIYHQRYIEVTTASAGSSTGLGWYPDPLIPFDKAVEYEENYIKSGKNQGVWITVYPDKQQPAGVYTGFFTLTADGKTYEIPARVTVIDYTLTDNVTARSVAVMSRGYMSQSGDDSLSTYKNYYDYLLKYRLNGNYLPTLTDDEELYLQAMAEYAVNPAVSTYCIPYNEFFNLQCNDSDVNFEKLEAFLWKAVNYSLEHKIDLLDKAVLYYATLTDEAEITGREDRAIRTSQDTENMKARMAEEISAMGDSAIHKSLAASVAKLPNLYTDRFYEKLYNEGDGVRNFCPMVNSFSSASEREKYADLGEAGDEYWWYTATAPHNPTPNWHIDADPQGMRMVSWMQKEYGVSGFLYWDVVYWNSALTVHGNGQIDPYTSPVRYSTPENGDGWLLYPGSYYGMDTPIGSNRLEHIRDGMEEYEMLRGIDETTEALNPSSDADKGILSLLYEKLYADAKIRSTSDEFMSVREELLDLAVAAQTYRTAITDVKKEADKYIFTVMAPADVSVSVSDEMQNGMVIGGNKEYIIEVPLIEEKNELRFTVSMTDQTTQENISHEISVALGGQTNVLNIAETEEDAAEFSSPDGKITLDKEVTTDFVRPGTAFVRVDLPAAEKGRQLFVYTSDKLKQLDEKTREISLMICTYNPGYTIEVSAKIEGEVIMESIGSFEVTGTGNTYTLSGVADLNWERCANKITALYFYVGVQGDSARTLWVDDVLYKNR